MSLKTTIEYLDGKIVVMEHRHMIRSDGVANVYRIIEEILPPGNLHMPVTSESIIPYCVVRKLSTVIKE